MLTSYGDYDDLKFLSTDIHIHGTVYRVAPQLKSQNRIFSFAIFHGSQLDVAKVNDSLLYFATLNHSSLLAGTTGSLSSKVHC